MKRGKYKGKNDRRQGRSHGVNQTLEWISAKGDFLGQRSHGEH